MPLPGSHSGSLLTQQSVEEVAERSDLVSGERNTFSCCLGCGCAGKMGNILNAGNNRNKAEVRNEKCKQKGSTDVSRWTG